jgi:hypothetical protein
MSLVILLQPKLLSALFLGPQLFPKHLGQILYTKSSFFLVFFVKDFSQVLGK